MIPGDVPVWVSGGSWGPKRARVEQCATLAAELAYHQSICAGDRLGPGGRGTLRWTPHGSSRTWDIQFEVRANAVWQRGRLFLQCPQCSGRATRLYVPVENLEPRCRRCWGLAYESQRWSYKPTGKFGRLLGPIGYVTTEERRRERREAAAKRYAERRPFLAR